MNINGLGESVCNSLYRSGLVKDVADLYYLKQEDIAPLDRMGDKSAQNLIDAIHHSKSNELHRLIYGLGVIHIGRKVSRLLSEQYRSMDNIISTAESNPHAFFSLDGCGNKIVASITNYFTMQETFDLVNKLKNADVNPENVSASSDRFTLADKRFVLTGTLSIPRRDVVAMIESKGGKVTGSVSKKTDYVVVGKTPGSKYSRAMELSIEILTEEQLEELLKI